MAVLALQATAALGCRSPLSRAAAASSSHNCSSLLSLRGLVRDHPSHYRPSSGLHFVELIPGKRVCGLSASLRTLHTDEEGSEGKQDVGLELVEEESCFTEKWMLTAASALSPLIFCAEDALAGNGEFGILEGRSASLLHPIIMGSLLVTTVWAGYLGWQWRRVRTIQDDINVLKKQVPAQVEGQAAPSQVETQIKELTETRKTLVKGGYRDRHFNVGSILLGLGVIASVGGALNTWFRTGKLFPGPHLFAGAGITVLWALAAALVPAMQKGNDTARSLHIGLNVLNLGLFIWQIPTGLEIVWKVLEFTKFP